MSQLIVFLALAFSIVIAIFAVQNTTAVDVSFLTIRASGVAVSVLVLVSALLGAGAMLLLGVAREIRHGLRHRSMSQQLRTAQARVSELEAAAPSRQGPAVSGQSSAVASDSSSTSASAKTSDATTKLTAES